MVVYCYVYVFVLTLGYALIQIPSLILSMFDYLKDTKFLRMVSKRGHTKVANDRLLREHVRAHAHAPMNRNTKKSRSTYGFKKQNIRRNIENRFRLLEDKIDKLITIAKLQTNWER